MECERSDGRNWWEVAPVSPLLSLGCFQKQDYCEKLAPRDKHGKPGPEFEYLEKAENCRNL